MYRTHTHTRKTHILHNTFMIQIFMTHTHTHTPLARPPQRGGCVRLPGPALQARHVGVLQLQQRLPVRHAARLGGHGGGGGGAEGGGAQGEGEGLLGAGGLCLEADEARLEAHEAQVAVQGAELLLVQAEPDGTREHHSGTIRGY